VFQAEQHRPRRLVALKMLRTSPWASRELLERFRGESEILARISHPNFVQVLEVGNHNGQPYFTMEYVEGGNLAQKLAIAPLAPREAAKLLLTLARAIETAHGHGVIHRDLKPSNVLMTADGSPRIGDFGLAKQIDGTFSAGQTETGEILGTPSYMAPEQAKALNKQVGPAADVYALGAILYESLTGRPPFKAASLLETLEQLRTQDPVPPRRLQPELPCDLETICLKCLQKEPAGRYETASALAADLERFISGKPTLARPISPWERAWKWARRSPALAGLLALSIVSVLAAVVGVVVHSVRLQSALNESNQNAGEAQRQQQLARGHYNRAQETLEKILAEFNNFRPGEVRQLQELQRWQLEDALAFYQGALNDQNDVDPQVRNDVAIAGKRVGDLQSVLGQHAAAAASYTRAIQLLSELPAALRETPANQFLLATCHNHRGVATTNQKEFWVDAERDHNAALEIFETQSQKNPEHAQWLSMVAETEHFLGALFHIQNKLTEAERHQLRADSLYTELSQKHPEDRSHLGKAADVEVNLALMYQSTKRESEASRTYEKAERHLLTLLALQPASADYLNSLGALYSNWGEFLGGRGDNQAALIKADKAIELAERALKNEPNHFVSRSRALSAHGVRANIYQSLSRWAEAVPEWDRVVELDPEPNAWLSRVLRTVAIAQAGLHVRAMNEVRILANNPAVSGDGVYELACACALSAKWVLSDQKIESAERNLLAERYALQAVAFLRQLQTQGYFLDLEHMITLATDDRLNSLRDRSDFKQLLPVPKAGKK